MVSRAVERKKLRKEKKRGRDEGCVVPNVNAPAPRNDDDDDDCNVVEDSKGGDEEYFGGHANNAGYSTSTFGSSSSAAAATEAAPKKDKAAAAKKVIAAKADESDNAAPVAKKAPAAKREAPAKKVTPAAAAEEAAGDSEPAEAPKAKARRVEKPKEEKATITTEEAAVAPIAVSSLPMPASTIVTKLSNLDRPLTRKERLKLETAQRSERQLERQQLLGERLDAAEASALQEYKASVAERKLKKKAEGVDEEGDDNAEDDDDDAPEAPKLPEILMRHDERFVGGTYWKERKELKRKTLFVGNLPMYYDQHITKDFIVGVLESHNIVDGTARQQMMEQKMLDFAEGKVEKVEKKKHGAKKNDKGAGLYGEVCPILSIDFLPVKANARTRHAYIAFRTVEISVAAQKLLDGIKPEANNINRLRVNFSDDKNQRETAIGKREGSKGLKGGKPGRGRGGAGRGGGRGAGRGGAGGRGGFSRGGAGGSRGGGRGRTFGPGFGFGRGAGASAPAASE